MAKYDASTHVEPLHFTADDGAQMKTKIEAICGLQANLGRELKAAFPMVVDQNNVKVVLIFQNR
ncbi:hypothetical protein KQI84_04135 [bacterium]|nr:hypothetical protein [bacterium]